MTNNVSPLLVQNDLAEYHKLGLDISELEKKIMSEMIRPERALLYLVPGRLVRNSISHRFCSFLRMRHTCSLMLDIFELDSTTAGMLYLVMFTILFYLLNRCFVLTMMLVL